MTHPLLTATVNQLPASSLPLLQIQSVGEGLGIIILALISGICLIALMITLTALLPQVNARGKAVLQRSPWRAFFIGLVNYIFLGGIVLVVSETGVELLNLVAVLILSFVVAVTAIGLSGLVALTGERLAGLHSRDVSPLMQLIWGTLVLELAGLLPFVGWFLLVPIVLMTAFGGAILGWRNRQ